MRTLLKLRLVPEVDMKVVRDERARVDAFNGVLQGDLLHVDAWSFLLKVRTPALVCLT